MPIHDWTRVPDGTFQDFHLAWIAEIRNALNGGVLPRTYYAQAEQIIGPLGPDVLTLQTNDPTDDDANGEPLEGSGGESSSGGVAVQVAAPRTRLQAAAEMPDYLPKRRQIVVRHASNDRIVALLEIVSPGNKASRNAFGAFVEKAVESLYRGFHLLIVDLFPPTPCDPSGAHGAIWAEISDEPFELPPDEPLTLVSYSAGPIKRAYIEPTAAGRDLIDLPLFLEPDIYVNVPLEATYRAAYRGVPQRWKRVLEG